jgi:amino acid permease
MFSFFYVPPSLSRWKPLMTATVAEEGEEESISAGNATVTQLFFSLVKGILGAAVLGLPARIVTCANTPLAVRSAIAVIAGIGGLLGYGFASIGRVCAYTNTKSYYDASSKTVGKSTSWLSTVAATSMTFNAILAYSMILGEISSSVSWQRRPSWRQKLLFDLYEGYCIFASTLVEESF